MFIKKPGTPKELQDQKKTREISVSSAGTVAKAEQSRWETMTRLREVSLEELRRAQEDNLNFLIIRHGKAPNKRGQVSIGSQIRTLIRSHAAGPYIFRSKCMQYESAFVVAIRPKKSNKSQ